MTGLGEFLLSLAITAVVVIAYVVALRVADALADRSRRQTRERIVQEEHQRATAAQVFKKHGPGGAA